MASKLCLTTLWGLIDLHNFRNDPQNKRRVCLKCGLLQTEVCNDNLIYTDYWWESVGVVDNPHPLVKKWKEEIEVIEKEKREIEKEKNASMYGKINWDDVK